MLGYDDDREDRSARDRLVRSALLVGVGIVLGLAVALVALKLV